MIPRVRIAPVLAAAILLSALASTPAHAQGAPKLLERARAEMAQLNFEAAINLLEQAEAAGGNGREQMLEIYRATAEAHASLGRADQAEVAFRLLLALDPTITLPAGSSPKLTTPFGAAAEFVSGRGALKIECRSVPEGVVLTVVSDPVDVVAAARLVDAAGAPQGDPVDGQGRITLAGKAPGCAALDHHGNELARADVSAAEAVPEPATGAGGSGATAPPIVVDGGSASTSRPLYARWWLWGGAAAVTGAVAVYYGLQLKNDRDDLDALNQDSENHYFPEALDIEERGNDHARNANIALGVTAALGAVSIGLLVYDLVSSSGEAAPDSGARVSAGVVPGGAGVQASWGF